MKKRFNVLWFGLTKLANWRELNGECVSYVKPTHTIASMLVLNTCTHPHMHTHTNKHASTHAHIHTHICTHANRQAKQNTHKKQADSSDYFSHIFTFNCRIRQANTFACLRTDQLIHEVNKTCDFLCNLMPCRAKELFLFRAKVDEMIFSHFTI